MGQWLGEVKNQAYPIFSNDSEISLATPMGLYSGYMARGKLSLSFTSGLVELTLTKAPSN